jgi:acyl carrier protein
MEESRQSLLLEELNRELRRGLADFMQPAAIRVVPSLPLTANGKVDRAALPTVDLSERVEYRAPQTDTERQLAQIWQSLLETSEPVSAAADFFRIGGHSLLATRMVLAIQQRWSIDLPLKDIFEWRTLTDLARHIERKTAKGAGRDAGEVEYEEMEW